MIQSRCHKISVRFEPPLLLLQKLVAKICDKPCGINGGQKVISRRFYLMKYIKASELVI